MSKSAVVDVPTTTLCAYVVTGSTVGPICPALATAGSRYCAAHQALDQGAVPRPVRAPTDPDVDVLPWSPTDVDVFATIAAQESHALKARRR